MAVLLGKDKVTQETVNDLHGDLVNLARMIQGKRTCLELYRRCRRTLFAQAFIDDADLELAKPFEPGPERAYWYFIKCWSGRNGVAGSNGGNGFCVRYSSKGGQPAKRWQSTVESIPAWRRRLDGVTILSECGIEICGRIEDLAGTVIYCDPPYLVKGEKYVHDFKSEDHKRLALALQRYDKTKVVVSYYDHPELDLLYPGWAKIKCHTTKAMVSSGKRDSWHKTVAPEVLLVNRDIEELF
jgi:DNA adenine methylase